MRRLARGRVIHRRDGEAPVLLRLLQCVSGPDRIGLSENAKCDRLGSGGGQIGRGVVAGLGSNIVGRPGNAIGPAIQLGEVGPEAVMEGHFQQPVEPPVGLFGQARQQGGVLVALLHARGQTVHGISRLGRIPERLGKVARVVPSAIDGKLFVAMFQRPVPMANIVYSGNGEAATLHVEEIDSLPEARFPYIAADRERPCGPVAGANDVNPGILNFGKVHHLEGADLRFDNADVL